MVTIIIFISECLRPWGASVNWDVFIGGVCSLEYLLVKASVLLNSLGPYNWVPIKLCKMTGSIHLFKITGMLKAKDIKLNENYLWETLEIDWKEVTMTFNGNKIDLPRVVIIKLQDKI